MFEQLFLYSFAYDDGQLKDHSIIRSTNQ